MAGTERASRGPFPTSFYKVVPGKDTIVQKGPAEEINFGEGGMKPDISPHSEVRGSPRDIQQGCITSSS